MKKTISSAFRMIKSWRRLHHKKTGNSLKQEKEKNL